LFNVVLVGTIVTLLQYIDEPVYKTQLESIISVQGWITGHRTSLHPQAQSQKVWFIFVVDVTWLFWEQDEQAIIIIFKF